MIEPKVIEILVVDDSQVQADGSTTRRYAGIGLGLSICRGFA